MSANHVGDEVGGVGGEGGGDHGDAKQPKRHVASGKEELGGVAAGMFGSDDADQQYRDKKERNNDPINSF